MSDSERRPASLDGGHRLAKPARAADRAKPAKVKDEKKPKTAGSGKRSLSVLAGPVAVVRKGAGKVWGVWDRAYDNAAAHPVRAVKVFGIVVAVFAVVAGLLWFQADHYARLDAARADAVKQGEGAVGRLMSYSFRSADRQVEKTQDLVTGKFKDDYAQFINTKIAPFAKNKQMDVQSSVDRSAVISSSLDEAVVLMYVDTDSEGQLSLTGGSTVSGLRVTLENEDGKWKVSDLTPV